MAKTRLDYVLSRMCDNGGDQYDVSEEFCRLYLSHGRRPLVPVRARWPWMTYNDARLVRIHMGLVDSLHLPALHPRPEPELAPVQPEGAWSTEELSRRVDVLEENYEKLKQGLEAILGRNLGLPGVNNQ